MNHLRPTPNPCGEVSGRDRRTSEEEEIKMMPSSGVTEELFGDLLRECDARSRLRQDSARPQAVLKYEGCFLFPPPDALISLEANGIYVFPSKHSYFKRFCPASRKKQLG